MAHFSRYNPFFQSEFQRISYFVEKYDIINYDYVQGVWILAFLIGNVLFKVKFGRSKSQVEFIGVFSQIKFHRQPEFKKKKNHTKYRIKKWNPVYFFFV